MRIRDYFLAQSSQSAGQIIFGHACDKMDYTHIIIFSGLGSALSAFLMWGFAKSLGMIFAFVIMFGSIVSLPIGQVHEKNVVLRKSTLRARDSPAQRQLLVKT